MLLTHNVKKIKGDADSINEALHLTLSPRREVLFTIVGYGVEMIRPAKGVAVNRRPHNIRQWARYE